MNFLAKKYLSFVQRSREFFVNVLKSPHYYVLPTKGFCLQDVTYSKDVNSDRANSPTVPGHMLTQGQRQKIIDDVTQGLIRPSVVAGKYGVQVYTVRNIIKHAGIRLPGKYVHLLTFTMYFSTSFDMKSICIFSKFSTTSVLLFVLPRYLKTGNLNSHTRMEIPLLFSIKFGSMKE